MKETLFSVLLICSGLSCLAQENETDSQDVVIFEASYIGDVLQNLSGGIKTGSSYLGLANLIIGFNTENAGWWKGGILLIKASNTHGDMPASRLLGDIQMASNIEAGNHTYIQELWIRQSFYKSELTIGLQDLNVEFANSEYGSLFLNSSFGIMPVISGNFQAPVFPLTSPGITFKWNVLKNTTWLNAVYDGCPEGFDSNPHNLKWNYNSGDGLLFISEIQRVTETSGLSGTYKLGMFNHNHAVEARLRSDFPDSLNQLTYGVYMHADQELWKSDNRSVGVFVQAGISPEQRSMIHTYLGLGLNCSGFLSRSDNDQAGIAIAHARLSDGKGSETTIELTWRKQVFGTIYIQPDLQYIIHPSGDSNLKNCLAGMIRTGFSF